MSQVSDEVQQEKVFEEIALERTRQDLKFGGPAHDDKYDPVHWCQHIQARAHHGIILTEWTENTNDRARRAKLYRSRLVEIGALAVAALNSFDRTYTETGGGCSDGGGHDLPPPKGRALKTW